MYSTDKKTQQPKIGKLMTEYNTITITKKNIILVTRSSLASGIRLGITVSVLFPRYKIKFNQKAEEILK